VFVDLDARGALRARAERGLDGAAMWSTDLAAALALDTDRDVRLARVGDQNGDGADDLECLAAPAGNGGAFGVA